MRDEAPDRRNGLRLGKRKKKLSKAVYGTSHTISLEEAKYVYRQAAGADRLIVGACFARVRAPDGRPGACLLRTRTSAVADCPSLSKRKAGAMCFIAM